MVAPDVGEGVAPGDLTPVYSYTWKIASLFEDLVEILAKDVTLPTFTISKETVDGSSLTYKFAGMVNWEDVKITFYDVMVNRHKVSSYLKQWRQRVWDSTKGLGSPSDYKKDTKIEVHSYDWDENLKSVWTLHNSWPQTVKEGDLTYTSTDFKVIDVIIAYDWAELDEEPGLPLYTTSGGLTIPKDIYGLSNNIPVQSASAGIGKG